MNNARYPYGSDYKLMYKGVVACQSGERDVRGALCT